MSANVSFCLFSVIDFLGKYLSRTGLRAVRDKYFLKKSKNEDSEIARATFEINTV